MQWSSIRVAGLGLAMTALVGLSIDASFAQTRAWAPGEVQISAEKELIDPEFSQTRAQIVWADLLGRMWLADVSRDTGAISPPDGRGILVDPDALSLRDAFITFNGPEWAHAARGDHIIYTKFVTGEPHSQATARLAVARQTADGTWTYGFVAPDAPRFAPYASDFDRDQAPVVTYVDPSGNHYARGTGPINSEVLIAEAAPSNIPLRPVRGARAVLFSKTVDGVRQVHRFDMATQLSEQLTFDPGDKAASWMWRAPEFGSEFVLSTVVNNTVSIYRYLPAPDGSLQWTPVRAIEPPAGLKIYSPEPFTYARRSYIVLALGTEIDDFPSQIWVASVDPQRPDLRLVSADTPLRVRADPEVFITRNGPRIYFNRFLTTGDPQPRKCFSVECSEGWWMADPGLAGAQ